MNKNKNKIITENDYGAEILATIKRSWDTRKLHTWPTMISYRRLLCVVKSRARQSGKHSEGNTSETHHIIVDKSVCLYNIYVYTYGMPLAWHCTVIVMLYQTEKSLNWSIVVNLEARVVFMTRAAVRVFSVFLSTLTGFHRFSGRYYRRGNRSFAIVIIVIMTPAYHSLRVTSTSRRG